MEQHVVAAEDVGTYMKPRGQADYPQDSSVRWVRGHQVWVDRRVIPAETVAKGAYLAVGIHSEKEGMMPIDKGPRDWDNHRLLLPLPAAASVPATTRADAATGTTPVATQGR